MIDLVSREVVATIAIPAGPARFVSFCDSRAWVSVSSEHQRDDAGAHEIAVVDMATLSQIATVEIGGAPSVTACSFDETELIVTSHSAGGRLGVVDTASLTLARVVPVTAAADWVVMSADGARGWTASTEVDVVTSVTADLAEATRVPVGSDLRAAAVSPDEKSLAVVRGESDELSILDSGTGQVLATISVGAGAGPEELVWTPDGQRVLTVNGRDETVSVVDLERRVVTARVPVPGAAGIAIDPTGAVYVTSTRNRTVTVLDTAARW